MVGAIITDDVFVIVALPEARVEGLPLLVVDPLNVMVGGDRFECADNVAEGGLFGGGGCRVDDDDAVNVVGHEDERAQVDVCKPLGQCIPLGAYHVARIVGNHCAIENITK